MKKPFQLPEKMARYRGQFEQSARDFLKLNTRKGKTGRYESKLAGDPYFPKSEQYPVDSQGKPMKLLAQINFSEMSRLENFPESGILLFFISVSDDVYGLNFDDPCEQSSFRIKYFENVIENEDELVDDFSFVKLEDELAFPIGCEASITPDIGSELVSASDFQFERYAGTDAWTFFEQFGDQEKNTMKCTATSPIRSGATQPSRKMIRGKAIFKNIPFCFCKLILMRTLMRCGEMSELPIFL